LKPYYGQPATALIAKLGYPTDQKTVADHKIYIWSTSHLVGDEGGTTQYYCTIRAVLDPNDIITNFDWEGNLGGCDAYMQRLGY
jgi:hypothetical protein